MTTTKIPSATPRARMEALLEPLGRLPEVASVEPKLDEDPPHLLARLARPIFGRELYFTLSPCDAGGLRLSVPNLMRVPISEPFAGLHLQAMVANTVLTGRCVLSPDGRLHYDLVSIGSEDPSTDDLHDLIEFLRADVRRMLTLVLGAACATLLPVSPEMASTMVDAVDEEAGSEGPSESSTEPEPAPRLVL